jgi:HAD superfamily hydrolase (TIGR01509 family)
MKILHFFSYKAFIFDMDGVIADTEPLKFEAYKSIFKEKYEVELPATDVSWRGKEEREVMRYWLNKFKLNGQVERLIKIKRERYLQILKLKELNPVAGVGDFIKEVKKISRTLALVTSSNKEDVDTVLKALGLEDHFRVVITLDDVDNPKPNPECYKKAIQMLGVEPRESIIFEDSPSGVLAAKLAGAVCVGIGTSFSAKDLRLADEYADSFKILLNEFDKKNSA